MRTTVSVLVSGSPCLLLPLLLAPWLASGEIAYVSMPHAQISSHCEMPRELPVTIEMNHATLTLRLQRNDEVDVNVPLYVIEVDSGGRSSLKLHRGRHLQGFATYQDPDYGASISLRCKGTGVKTLRFEMEGHVFHEGQKYRLVSTRQRLRRSQTAPLSQVYRVLRDKEVAAHDTIRSGRQRRDFVSELTPRQRAGRSRRAALGPFYIDILVVVDNAAYRDWLSRNSDVSSRALEELRRYYAHVINGVDLRYKSIPSNLLSISVRLVGFVVSNTAGGSPWTERHRVQNGTSGSQPQVNADTALDAIQQWANSTVLPPNDHAMFFTGYDLYGADNGFRFNYTTGLAFISTLCKTEGRSTSIVEDHGGFQSIGTAAHELGHSFGAEHDGQDNACRAAERFIMAGQSYNESGTNRQNPWRFSSCSIQYFRSYLTQLQSSPEGQCLTRKINVSSLVPDVTNQMPGQIYGPDDQCKQIYGAKSYMCRGTNFGEPADICRAMFCRNTATADRCVLVTAARGTSCGNKKWCIEGECVSDQNAPAKNMTCPFGDQTGDIVSSLDCGELVTNTSGFCYNKNFRERCCQSCEMKNSHIQGCEYGDKYLNCQTSYCGQNVLLEDGSLYDAKCCGTCGHSTSSVPPAPECTAPELCLDRAIIENMTCSQYIEKRGRHLCYTPQLSGVCCQTCHCLANASAPDTCKWGDAAGDACRPLQGSRTPCNPQNLEACCDTCSKISTTSTSTTVTTPRPTTPRPPTSPTVGDGGGGGGGGGSAACRLSNLLVVVVAVATAFTRIIQV